MFERQLSDGNWTTVFHLLGSPGVGNESEDERFPLDVIPYGQMVYVPSAAILGPLRFRVPSVKPGGYRIRQEVVLPNGSSVAVATELEIRAVKMQ